MWGRTIGTAMLAAAILVSVSEGLAAADDVGAPSATWAAPIASPAPSLDLEAMLQVRRRWLADRHQRQQTQAAIAQRGGSQVAFAGQSDSEAADTAREWFDLGSPAWS